MERSVAGAVDQGIGALTEKEKQTLRLLLVGHDAKSMARELGLSVHTVNERLRDARRKLAVGSSKEAARRLHDAERPDPHFLGDAPLGDAPAPAAPHPVLQPDATPPPSRRARPWVIGGMVMTLMFAALLALGVPAPAPFQTADTGAATETAAGRVARAWLSLVDAADWSGSWAATGASFRRVNTVANWQQASERARAPLGPVRSRTLVGEQDTPAPPGGYRTVSFRTDFANRQGATETVALDREGGAWKVVGVYIE
jgi:DNA-binding CsgD family transcriptional regulator